MSQFDPVKNFAIATLSAGYNSSATAIGLIPGDISKFPNPLTEGQYNVTWWDSTLFPSPDKDSNVEVTRVLTSSVDTLYVLRAQEGTSASNKNTGGSTYKVALTFSKKTYDDITNSLLTKYSSTGGNITVTSIVASLGSFNSLTANSLSSFAITSISASLQSLTSQQIIFGDGTKKQTANFNPETTIELYDDFIGGDYSTSGLAIIGELGWTWNINSLPGGFKGTLTQETNGTYGSIVLGPGGSQNNYNILTLGNTNCLPNYGSLYNTRISPSLTSNNFAVKRFGIGIVSTSATGEPTDGVWFACTGGSNWFAYMKSISEGVSSVDTGINFVVPPNNFSQKNFKIICTSTSALFYIQNLLKATFVHTGIANGRVFYSINTELGSNPTESISIDYFYYSSTALTRN